MRPESATPCLDNQATGMALSILAEIGQMLDVLANDQQPGSIDLRSLPLTEADRDELESLLGTGEIKAELELSGQSEIWETAYSGVWWIRHRGAGDKILSEEIAVCSVPEILQTHPVDIEAAARRLQKTLTEATNG